MDFQSEPWPHISEAAKDCVKRLLDMDPAKRLTTEQARRQLLVGECAFVLGTSRPLSTHPRQASHRRAGTQQLLACECAFVLGTSRPPGTHPRQALLAYSLSPPSASPQSRHAGSTRAVHTRGSLPCMRR